MERQGEGPTGMPTKTRVEDLLAFLGRPHMLAVLFHVAAVAAEPIRFNQLQKALGISQNTLTQRLKELVAAGFLIRRSYDQIPPKVTYEPGPKTFDLVPAFKGLHAWCDRHALAEAS